MIIFCCINAAPITAATGSNEATIPNSLSMKEATDFLLSTGMTENQVAAMSDEMKRTSMKHF